MISVFIEYLVRLKKQLTPSDDCSFRKILSTVTHLEKDFSPIKGKVLLVSSTLGPGGAERQITNTLVGLQKEQKFDVKYLGLNLTSAPLNDFFLHLLKENMIPFHSVENFYELDTIFFNRLSPEFKLVKETIDPYLANQIVNALKILYEERPSVVHLWLDETNIVFGIASCLLGINRIILSCRSLNPMSFAFGRPYMLSAYKALVKQPGVRLTNNSYAGAASYAEWLKISEKDISVIHNGFDFDDREKATLGRERPDWSGLPFIAKRVHVGGIMRFGIEKRPMLWIETCEEILKIQGEGNFVIMGGGAEFDKCVDYVGARGLSEHFHFTGVVENPEVYLKKVDVLLLTSAVEGLPNVVIEAQSFGVPVVATDVGGVSECIDYGRTGFYRKTDDPHLLALEIVELLNNAEKRLAFGDAAQTFVRDKFGLKRMIAQTISEYNDK